MNLYHWPTVEALADYAPGDVIVMADTLEQARNLAIAKYVAEYGGDDFETEIQNKPPVIHCGPIAILIFGSA